MTFVRELLLQMLLQNQAFESGKFQDLVELQMCDVVRTVEVIDMQGRWD